MSDFDSIMLSPTVLKTQQLVKFQKLELISDEKIKAQRAEARLAHSLGTLPSTANPGCSCPGPGQCFFSGTTRDFSTSGSSHSVLFNPY